MSSSQAHGHLDKLETDTNAVLNCKMSPLFQKNFNYLRQLDFGPYFSSLLAYFSSLYSDDLFVAQLCPVVAADGTA